MKKEIFFGEVIITICIILLIGLAISVLSDEYTDKKRKKIILVIVAVILSLIAQNCLEFWLIWYHSAPFIRTLVAIYGYVIRPVVILLYIYIVNPDGKHMVEWIAVGLNTALYLTATFSGFVFSITEDNAFSRGPLGYISMYLCAGLLVYLLYVVLVELWHTRRKESFIPVLLVILAVVSEMADIELNYKRQLVDYITIGALIDTLFFYIWLHIRFVRNYEKNLKTEQRIQLMLSQIQPYFIYNSLSSISELCGKDPAKAQQLTNDFADYLRYNFKALTEETMIPFNKQMEQVNFYIAIEKARYKDKLNVVYDIHASSFYLPNLTLQPIVENAVKHGICKHNKSGTLTIKTYESDNAFVIEITDDGVGFDVDEVLKDKKTYFGIQNVRERLMYYKNDFQIVSEKNKGTVVTISVPKQNKIRGEKNA